MSIFGKAGRWVLGLGFFEGKIIQVFWEVWYWFWKSMGRDMAYQYLKKGLAYLADFFPSRKQQIIDAADTIIDELDEDFSNGPLIRDLFRLLRDKNMQGLSDKLKGMAWNEVKEHLTPEIMKYLNASKKGEAIKRIKATILKDHGIKIKSKVIGPEIDKLVAHKKGKRYYKIIEALRKKVKEREKIPMADKTIYDG